MLKAWRAIVGGATNAPLTIAQRPITTAKQQMDRKAYPRMKFRLTPEEKAAKAAAYCVKPQDERRRNPDSGSEDTCRTSFVTQAQLATFFICLGVFFLLLGFAFNTPQEIGRGLEVILTSPANLITDYFELANVGATLVNAGAMLLFTLGVIGLSGANITGAVIAGLFTVTGFSFFGKNLLNTLPIMLGVYAYAKMLRLPLSSVIVQSLFGTSLGPLVSEICFNVGLPLLPALVLGIASGILVGLIMTPLAAHFIRFHKGYSLYNIGFTAGIIGMVFMAVLRGFGVKIETVSILSKGNTVPFAIVLYGLFAMMLILGLLLNRWRIKGLSYLFSLTGALSTDFTALAGFGATTINMSLLGMLGTTYALAVGGEINGPVIGGILTVVGFGAYGKHVRNVIPVLLGVFLVNLINIHDVNASFAILAALFGTTLAPIAGRYGVVAGIVAGALHMSLVTNISFLHAGMNLYNNGFSGGFIAAFISPLWEAFGRLYRKQPPV